MLGVAFKWVFQSAGGNLGNFGVDILHATTTLPLNTVEYTSANDPAKPFGDWCN